MILIMNYDELMTVVSCQPEPVLPPIIPPATEPIDYSQARYPMLVEFMRVHMWDTIPIEATLMFTADIEDARGLVQAADAQERKGIEGYKYAEANESETAGQGTNREN